MTTRSINKVLIAQEDLALGQGSTSQTRQGVATSVSQIDLPWVLTSIIDIQRLDTIKYKHCIYDTGTKELSYSYDAASAETVDNYSYIAPNIGSGQWVLQADSSDATASLDNGAPSINLQKWVDGGKIKAGQPSQAIFSSLDDAVQEAVDKGMYHTEFFGEWEVSATLLLPSGFSLTATGGVTNSTIKLADGANVDVIKSENFDTQTGTNNWLVADGVDHSIWLDGFSIDGNKANNSSGRGVALYAKRFGFGKLFIRNTAGHGWYSECSDAAGQNQWEDMPEANCGTIWVRDAGDVGFLYRGSHDGHIKEIYVRGSTSHNVHFDKLLNTYSGLCNVGHIHSYSSLVHGVKISDHVRCDNLISESNLGAGVMIDGYAYDSTMIRQLWAFNNNKNNTTSWRNVEVQVNGIQIGQLNILDSNTYGQGLRCSANGLKIGSGIIDGNSAATGTAVELDGAQRADISCEVRNWSGSGAVALDTTGIDYSNIDLIVTDCDTVWNNASAGTHNKISLKGNLGSGQAVLSGSNPGATESTNISINLNGANKLSRKKIFGSDVSAQYDLNVATEQTVTIAHEYWNGTPSQEEVQISLYAPTADTSWTTMYHRIKAIDATNITLAFKVSGYTGGVTQLVYPVVSIG